MRRLTAAVAFAGFAALTVAAPSAHACSPAPPTIEIDRERVVAGTRLHVSGDRVLRADGSGTACDGINLPMTPSPSDVGVTAEPEPEPSETPLVSLPPVVPIDVRPVAYAPADPATLVTLSITPGEFWDWSLPKYPLRVIDRVPAEPVRKQIAGWYRHSFAATVTVPADLKPGRYVIYARQQVGVDFGSNVITVVDSLAATGTATAGLVRLGLLAVATGTGVLAIARSRRLQPDNV